MQQQFWHSVSSPLKMEEQAQAPVGCVLNGFCKGGSGIFGFRLVWRCLSAALYFISNQSLRVQDNSPAGTQSRIFSEGKPHEVQEKSMKQEPSFESHAVPWLLAANIGRFPFLNGSLLVVT